MPEQIENIMVRDEYWNDTPKDVDERRYLICRGCGRKVYVNQNAYEVDGDLICTDCFPIYMKENYMRRVTDEDCGD